MVIAFQVEGESADTVLRNIRLRLYIQCSAGNVGQGTGGVGNQLSFMSDDRIPAGVHERLTACGGGDDSGYIPGPGLMTGNRRRPDGAIGADHIDRAAARIDRLGFQDMTRHRQYAKTKWGINLVRRECQRVYAVGLHVGTTMRRILGRIDEQQRAVSMREPGYACNVGNVAGQI